MCSTLHVVTARAHASRGSKRFVGTTGLLAESTDCELFRYWILLLISGSSSEVAPEVPTLSVLLGGLPEVPTDSIFGTGYLLSYSGSGSEVAPEVPTCPVLPGRFPVVPTQQLKFWKIIT